MQLMKTSFRCDSLISMVVSACSCSGLLIILIMLDLRGTVTSNVSTLHHTGGLTSAAAALQWGGGGLLRWANMKDSGLMRITAVDSIWVVDGCRMS